MLKTRKMVFWIEDDVEAVRGITILLRRDFGIESFFGGEDISIFIKSVEQAASISRPTVTFLISRHVPELDELKTIIRKFRPRAVISDLELGDDALGGLSVLSAVADEDRGVFLGLFSGRVDESIERLGVCPSNSFKQHFFLSS